MIIEDVDIPQEYTPFYEELKTWPKTEAGADDWRLVVIFLHISRQFFLHIRLLYKISHQCKLLFNIYYYMLYD